MHVVRAAALPHLPQEVGIFPGLCVVDHVRNVAQSFWRKKADSSKMRSSLYGFSPSGVVLLGSARPSGEIGRHEGLKIPSSAMEVRVRFPPRAHQTSSNAWGFLFLKIS